MTIERKRLNKSTKMAPKEGGYLKRTMICLVFLFIVQDARAVEEARPSSIKFKLRHHLDVDHVARDRIEEHHSNLLPSTLLRINPDMTSHEIPFYERIPKTLEKNRHHQRTSLSLTKFNDTTHSDPNTGCHARIVNGHLSVSSSGGVVDIETFYGTFPMNEADLGKSIFYGPIRVIWNNGICVAHLIGETECKEFVKDETEDGHYCFPRSNGPEVALWMVVTTLLICAALMMRYMYIRLFYSPQDFKLIKTTRGILHYEAVYHKTTEGVVWFSKKRKAVDTGDLIASEFRVKMTPRTVLLCVLLCFSPRVNAAEVHDLYSLSVVMTHGETLSIGDGVLHLDQQINRHNLDLEYFTTEYESKLAQSWYCSLEDCNSNKTCTSYGPRGHFDSSFVKHEGGDNDAKTYKWSWSYCKTGTTGCAFKNGCQKVWVTFSSPSSELLGVHSLFDSTELVNITLMGSEHATISSVSAISEFPTSEYSILHNNDDRHYLCPFPASKYTPKVGSLGDVQITHHGAFVMDPSSIACECPEWTDCTCDVATSFMKDMRQVCHQLPTNLGPYSLWMEDGFLMSVKDENLKVDLISTRSLNVNNMPTDCGLVRGELWGVRGSGFPLVLSLKTEKISLLETKKVRSNCSNFDLLVPCDGMTHTYSITDSFTCKFIDGLLEDKVTDSEIAGLIGFDTYSGGDDNGAEGSFWDKLMSDGPKLLAGILGIGSATIILIIIIMVVLKIAC